MVKVENWQDPKLREAFLIWTGYGHEIAPLRDNSVIIQKFGSDASGWISLIDSLVDEFYKSNAHIEAADLQEMRTMAIADFEAKYPDAPEEIISAIAWCYTFDYR